MLNTGLVLSEIDGSEYIYEHEDYKIPEQFSYMKNLPDVIDQGSDPFCVPCSISACAEFKLSLKTSKKTNNKFNLFDIYCSKTSGGNGMTCKEAFKYVIDNGIKYNKTHTLKFQAYYKITNTICLKHAILNNGPCILVLPINNATDDNFWNGNYLEGYHAVSVVGYDTDGFIIRNSWGKSYGYNGYSHISNEDILKAKEIWTLI